MQKILKKISSLLLAIVMCFGITAVAHGVSSETITVDAATVSDYYSEITAKSGRELSGQLHDLIVSTHTRYTSYNDCKTYAATTDPGKGSDTVMELYTQTDINNSNFDKSGGWNREHVWAQSDSGGLWGTSGAGSDLHHIRPAEKDINNSRGNKKYGEVTNGTYEYTGTTKIHGGFSNSSTFMPMPNVKGDIARIIMYVYLHYNNTSNVGGSKEAGATHGTLKFTQIITASNEDAAKKLLLEWNKADPVDDIERARNDAVYGIQKNRNPFIDNESYADAIWGDGTVTPTPTPGGDTNTLTALTINKSTLNLTVGASETLSVTATPSGASNSVTWSSSNSAVATVSNGNVTAVAEGSARITATSTVNKNITATATVTVTKDSSTTPPRPDNTHSITIDYSSFNNPGGYNVYDWTAGGVSGAAYLYGSAGQMQFNSSKSSRYVASTTPTPGPITSVTLKLESSSKGWDWQLLTSTSAYSTPSNGNPSGGTDHLTKTANSSGVTWDVSGSDTYFALIYTGSGVTYIDSIVVTYGTGGSVTPDPDVPVDPSVTLQGLTISHEQCEFEVGDALKLSVIPNPSNADASVTWTSSDTSVATVSADGLVTAVKAGTATITATSTVNPEISVTCQVTVKAADTPTDPDGSKVTAFLNAVAAIDSDAPLYERYQKISTAISLYQSLNSAEKAQVSSNDLWVLKSAIAKYNEDVNSYNGAAEGAENSAWHAFTR